MKERLQKILSRAGLASRREAEEWLRQGRIRVNGKVVTSPGTKADVREDSIRVDGRLLARSGPAPATYALHKPRGVVSTRRDPQGRRTVMDLAKGLPGRLYPIGRLDHDAEGLLLLTSDGDLAYRLLRPGAAARVYHVKVRGEPEEPRLAGLRRGIVLDGSRTLPAGIRRLRSAPGRSSGGGRRSRPASRNSWLEVTLHEGRRNQIVRMFERIGHPVMRLRRIRIGPIALGRLPPGRCRPLTDRELAGLRKGSGDAAGAPRAAHKGEGP